MNNWTDLVVDIVVALIPIIAAYVSRKLVANKQAATIVQIVEPLAEAAVTAAEQAGVAKQLDGTTKKSGAVQSVMDSLAKLGFTKADGDMVGDAVEKAFSNLKGQLHSTYQTASEAKASTDSTSTTTTTAPVVSEGSTNEDKK